MARIAMPIFTLAIIVPTIYAPQSPAQNATTGGVVTTNWKSPISSNTGTFKLSVNQVSVKNVKNQFRGFCFGFNLSYSGGDIYNNAILQNHYLSSTPITVGFYTPINSNGAVQQIEDFATKSLETPMSYSFTQNQVKSSQNNLTAPSNICVSQNEWQTNWQKRSSANLPVQAAIQIRYAIGPGNYTYSRFVYFPISTELFKFLPNNSKANKANVLLSNPPVPDLSRPMFVGKTAILSCENDSKCINYVRGPNVLGQETSVSPYQAWTQLSHPVIVGEATPGSTLTVSGGEWVGPNEPKYIFSWQHCTNGQSGDIASGYAAGPYFYYGMTTVNFRPTIFCGQFGGSIGPTYKVPENQTAGYITVFEFVWTMPNATGFGYYESAVGKPLTTNGIAGVPPHVNSASVLICPISCTDPHAARPINGYSEGFAKTIDSELGQWTTSSDNGSTNQFVTPQLSWYLCDAADSKWTNQMPSNCTLSTSSSNTRKYTVQQSDAGKYIRLCGQATNTSGTTTQCSPTYYLTWPAYLISKPSLTGSTSVGSTLSINGGVYGGAPKPEFYSAWYACDYIPPTMDAAIVNMNVKSSTTIFPSCGSPIGSRNASALQITSAYLNKIIMVVISQVNEGNGETGVITTYLVSPKVQ